MKTIYTLLIILIIIAVIGLTRAWQTSLWDSSSDNFLTGLKPIEVGRPPGLSSLELNEYQDLTSSDGLFGIKYPSNWFLIKNEGLLQATVPIEWQEKYDFENLFLAQQLTSERFAQLIVGRGEFNIPPEEIIDEMIKINKEQGWTMEIIESDIREIKSEFKSKYLVPESPNLYSRELILRGDDNILYFVAFIAYEQDWSDFAEQADFILNSARIIE